jgi:hypothetical protein
MGMLLQCDLAWEVKQSRRNVNRFLAYDRRQFSCDLWEYEGRGEHAEAGDADRTVWMLCV